MTKSPFFRRLAAMLAVFHVLMIAQVPLANAAMIGTGEVLTQQQQQVDRQQLLSMLDDQQVKDKLLAMGVERDQVENRINNLTSAELAQFNQQLSEAPAGAGIVGIIVLFLVIFIITDMLCATDIFSFVKCINR
ncbi:MULTISPECIES: PA2779 family protein [unclassified Pseudomonas]|uniref:PA2779 family protein n=1 Tax=unclassified Pseudomonas TaxID=196821 RepID=UPI000489F0D2|nr:MULTISPECIES: PA2779 family protein [unclassified Pseudomonas]MBD9399082.1 PA2779 family protein [Pseudomonas sp. PDM11]